MTSLLSHPEALEGVRKKKKKTISTTARFFFDKKEKGDVVKRVKEDLGRLCYTFKRGDLDKDAFARHARALLNASSSDPKWKMQIPMLMKRAEATCGTHFCALWNQCKERCQFDARGLKWEEEIRVYRSFEEPVPVAWTSRGIVSETCNKAQTQFILDLRRKLSETEEELERLQTTNHAPRRSKEPDCDRRKNAFQGLLAHMDALVVKRVEDDRVEERTNDDDDEDDVVSPHVSPENEASLVRSSSPPPLSLIERKTSSSSSSQDDWPYRDVFPQFLRKSSKKRHVGLIGIVDHMETLSRKNAVEPQTRVVEPDEESVLASWKRWLTARWMFSTPRERVLIAIAVVVAVYCVSALLRRRRVASSATVARMATSYDRNVHGLARFLPYQSIFSRLQRIAAVPECAAPRTTGIARFLPPESIFSRLQRRVAMVD